MYQFSVRDGSVVQGGAVISEDGRYRYSLTRIVDTACPLKLCVLGVNPSTADWTHNDPTIRRVINFTLRWGYGSVTMGNEFAWRDTKVENLRALQEHEAIGPENDSSLERMMKEADMVVAGWGALGKLPPTFRKRWQDVVRIADAVGKPLWCLGVCDDGQPLHPLYRPKDTVPVPWKAPWFANRNAA